MYPKYLYLYLPLQAKQNNCWPYSWLFFAQLRCNQIEVIWILGNEPCSSRFQIFLPHTLFIQHIYFTITLKPWLHYLLSLLAKWLNCEFPQLPSVWNGNSVRIECEEFLIDVATMYVWLLWLLLLPSSLLFHSWWHQVSFQIQRKTATISSKGKPSSD